MDEFFTAALPRMTEAELREQAATELVGAHSGQERQKLDACLAEARRRHGGDCFYGHAYLDLMWGPDVADHVQTLCCISLARPHQVA